MKTRELSFTDARSSRCELASEVLRSSGTLRLGVTGWSMFPTLWPGDTLVIERTKSDAVCPGDIVLYTRDRRFFVHRMVAKSAAEQSIQTRGDAMPQMDPPVLNRELLGRVVSILRNGKCIEPSRKISLGKRSVGALVGHSETAARVVLAVHGVLQSS